MKWGRIVLRLTAISVFAFTAIGQTEDHFPDAPGGNNKYIPSTSCKTCHSRIYEQHKGSMHAMAFENPVFQAQYFKDVLPRASKELGFYKISRSCAACHMPVAYQYSKGRIVKKEFVDPKMAGVTCDFCHRISAYQGDTPGGGNFVAKPGMEN